MTQKSQHPRESGFTLVVIAALFIAFAVVGAATLERNSTMANITKRDAATAQLNRLSEAIIQYSIFNSNLYPCPARFDLLSDDAGAKFGMAVSTANTGYAQDCSSTTSDGTGTLPKTTITGYLNILGPTAGPHTLVMGMVPVTSLSQYGIGINDAFDPWNNRIMYVVNRTMTTGSATSSQSSNPNLTDARTGYTITKPDFILISYGRDGKGGFSRSTASTTQTITCPNENTAQREENCDLDSTAVAISAATRATPVQITTTAAHGLAIGDTVYIAGVVGMTELNGNYYKVGTTAFAATTFTLQDITADTDVNGTGYTIYGNSGTVSAIKFTIAPTNTSSKATAANYFDDILTWYRK